MQMAIKGAGFTPGEADQLRRAMAAWRRTGKISIFKEKFINGMLANPRGYEREFAERCFSQIEGFAEYGFPESHAASFALLVYASCWLKCHYPDVFVCALLNSQPMGFYAPSQLVRDSREHGVEIRPPDINLSLFDSLLENDGWKAADHVWPRHAAMKKVIRTDKAVRLGLRTVGGLAERDITRIVEQRDAGYTSVRDLWLRTGLPIASLEKLAGADAFASLQLNRREALWAVKGLVGTHGAETLPLFAASGLPAEPARTDAGNLPLMQPGEEVIHDYATLSLSLKGHPVEFLRPMLQARGTTRAANLGTVTPGHRIEVAGLVLVRQRPGTASGVIFATLEDETGVANIVVWPKLFEDDRIRKILLSSRMLAVRGELQSDGAVIHIIAHDMEDLTPHLLDLSHGRDIGNAIIARADEGRSGPQPGRERNQDVERARRQAYAALPGGRNFH